MTLKEFREKVAESKHSNWLNDLSLNLKYQNIPEPISLSGISDIYRFFKNQKDEWKKKPEQLPNQLKSVRDHFVECSASIERFINQQGNYNGQQLSKTWNNLVSQINSIKVNNNNDIKVLKADSPEVDRLIDIQKNFSSTSFNAAYDYLILDRVQQNNNSSPYWRGIILAYEFQLQGHTELLQRRNNEKKSLGLLRSNLEAYLSEAEDATADYLKRTHDNFEEHANSIKVLEKKKDELFDQWFANSKNSYQEFYSKMESDADEMKELFREGLRFAGPVKHWRRRALKMKKNGAFWIKWLIGSSAVVAISLFLLLVMIPEGMTKSLFEGDPLAIKWAIIYVTFVSFMVYAVRTFARLTFSSYHLSRDAEEREQLTHVYLALKKDGNVEEKDRVLILQSLFSRAETGLLKDDASPTLPGNSILNKINGSN